MKEVRGRKREKKKKDTFSVERVFGREEKKPER